MIARRKKITVRLPKLPPPEPETFHTCRLCLQTRREYDFPVDFGGRAVRGPSIMSHKKSKLPEPIPGSAAERFNLALFVDRLIIDLELLRAGRISIREAKARSELAKQVLRGVHYIVTAQKFLEGQATQLPSYRGKTMEPGD
jgi:hypothetical protein